MYGAPARNRQPAPGSPAPNALDPSLGMYAGAPAAAKSHLPAVPAVLVVLAGMYFTWALVQQHERVQDAVEPSNIALNVHNLFAIFLTTVLALVLGKIALAKASAATSWDWLKSVAAVVAMS